MAHVQYTEYARADVNEIVALISADNLDAALTLRATIEQVATSVAQLPGMGRLRPELAAGVQPIPVMEHYLLYYQQIAEGIEIIHVLHSVRDISELLARNG